MHGTAKSTLAEELRLGEVDVHELYAAMDWLLARQKRIENKLAKRHLQGGLLVLFDVSSSYYTGRKSSLVKHGYSRDHRGDHPQIVYGLLCDSEGRPYAEAGFPQQMNPESMGKLIDTQKKMKAKGKEEVGEELKPDYTYIQDLVAGRPVFAYPLEPGGC